MTFSFMCILQVCSILSSVAFPHLFNGLTIALFIHTSVPNPAPLGLIGFGLTTALLQVKHTRLGGEGDDDLDGVDTVVLGFAMFFGGLL